jgi:hypothetical protein
MIKKLEPYENIFYFYKKLENDHLASMLAGIRKEKGTVQDEKEEADRIFNLMKRFGSNHWYRSDDSLVLAFNQLHMGSHSMLLPNSTLCVAIANSLKLEDEIPFAMVKANWDYFYKQIDKVRIAEGYTTQKDEEKSYSVKDFENIKKKIEKKNNKNKEEDLFEFNK